MTIAEQRLTREQTIFRMGIRQMQCLGPQASRYNGHDEKYSQVPYSLQSPLMFAKDFQAFSFAQAYHL